MNVSLTVNAFSVQIIPVDTTVSVKLATTFRLQQESVMVSFISSIIMSATIIHTSLHVHLNNNIIIIILLCF